MNSSLKKHFNMKHQNQDEVIKCDICDKTVSDIGKHKNITHAAFKGILVTFVEKTLV